MAAIVSDGRKPTLARVEPPSDRPKGSRIGSALAKEKFLHLRRTEKITVKEAMRRIGYSVKAYEDWRRRDPEFKEACDRIQGIRDRDKNGGRKPVPDFPEFCETYLGMTLFWHQLQWYDLLEGRAPRDLHEAETYEPGSDPHLLLVNTPPGHAKSTTITAAYVLWRMMKDPNVQIVLVSKNETMAKKWMFQIQDWLTSNTFARLHEDFGPEGGFKQTSRVWTTTQIYFGSELRDQNAKDPTLEVLGLGGHIYGARADLIILDDVVDNKNSHEFEKQIEWLTGMVLTRPADEDKVLIVGTRVAPVDLYSELRNPKYYEDDESPWTYFAQPAVLEFAEEPKDWVTLWPRSNIVKRGKVDVQKPDADGLYPKWDGESLFRMKRRISTYPNAWPLNYQQQDVTDNMPFPREAVYGCVNKHRKIGLLSPGVVGVPPTGMHGLYVVAGLDPATAGHTAIVVIALDRKTGQRYVLNVLNRSGMLPDDIRETVKAWTLEYQIKEWRIERNAFQTWLTKDREINRWCAARGVTVSEHTTGRNKLDQDFGVGSMKGLFVNRLIDIPHFQTPDVHAFLEQLCTWFPETKGKTDTVMALWFADLRCRDLVDDLNENDSYRDSPWLSPVQEAAQITMNAHEYEQAVEDGFYGGWWN